MKTIIEMAREANVYCTTRQPTLDAMLERFAALVRADAFEQGRQEGMKQERALWELSRLGQEIEAQPEERNFCPRCGKRTADLTTIHTCTPPIATDPKAFHGFPSGLVSTPNAGGKCVTAGETAPIKEIDPNAWAFDRGLEST